MKNVKVLASIAALATVSCMAAVSASAASSIDFELNAAKSNASTKVIDVVLSSDVVTSINNAFIDITFSDAIDGSAITVASEFPDAYLEQYEGQTWTLVADGGAGNWFSLTKKSLKIAELTIPAAYMTAEVSYNSITGNNAVAIEDGDATKGTIAVVDATEVGLFTEGTGAPAKAYKAAATVAGDLTWFVTDGTNVASKAATISGAPGVVFGLVATGANAANINYAAIAID
jgi:hypothetical protein